MTYMSELQSINALFFLLKNFAKNYPRGKSQWSRFVRGLTDFSAGWVRQNTFNSGIQLGFTFFFIKLMDTYFELIKFIHQKIKENLQKNQRSVAWLARKLNLDTSNFAKKLNDYSIQPEMLVQICIILGENFFLYYFLFVEKKMPNGKN